MANKVNTQTIGSLHSYTSKRPEHSRHNTLTQEQLFKAATAMSQRDHGRKLATHIPPANGFPAEELPFLGTSCSSTVSE